MSSPAKPSGLPQGLSSLRTDYESKAQQVLADLVQNSNSGRLDIFTLLKLIAKRLPFDSIPNKRNLSAGGSESETHFFAQILTDFEELRTQIKKFLKSPVLKICLQKAANSEECSTEYQKLKEMCKQVRHSIMAKLHLYELSLTKDFVIVECLTRLIQIVEERQRPTDISKAMTLIWRLLRDCELTHRFLSYKHVNQIIDQLCTICEQSSEGKVVARSQSPSSRRKERSHSNRSRVFDTNIKKPSDKDLNEQISERIKTISKRLAEFSSPQPKLTPKRSLYLERSQSSRLDIDFGRKPVPEDEEEREPSVVSRLRSSKRSIPTLALNSKTHEQTQGGFVSNTSGMQGNQANPLGAEEANSAANRFQTSKLSKTQERAIAVAGMDDTFLSEVSGSSISFRDFPSGSKKSHRMLKGSAQKTEEGVKPAKMTLSEASESLLKQLGQAGEQVSFMQPQKLREPTFEVEKVESVQRQLNYDSVVTSREESPLKKTYLFNRSPGKVVIPPAQASPQRFLHTIREETRPLNSIPIPFDDLAANTYESTRLRRSSQTEADKMGFGEVKRPKTLTRSQPLVQPVALEIDHVSQEADAVIDPIVREITRSLLEQELQLMHASLNSASKARIIEAQIFSLHWNNQSEYDFCFECCQQSIKYCTLSSSAAIELVQGGFDLEALIRIWNSRRTILPTWSPKTQHLGKRDVSADLEEPVSLSETHLLEAGIPFSRNPNHQGFDSLGRAATQSKNSPFKEDTEVTKISGKGLFSMMFRKKG